MTCITKLILIGGGGHCKSCIDVIEQIKRFTIVGIVDKPENIGKLVLGYKIIDSDRQIEKYVSQGIQFLITIGYYGRFPGLRMEIFDRIKIAGGVFPAIISPRAYVSQYASVSEGTIIMHNAIINASVSIGCNSIINTGAIIEHDSTIGSHAIVMTGAVIKGGSRVADMAYVGSNITYENNEN